MSKYQIADFIVYVSMYICAYNFFVHYNVLTLYKNIFGWDETTLPEIRQLVVIAKGQTGNMVCKLAILEP